MKTERKASTVPLIYRIACVFGAVLLLACLSLVVVAATSEAPPAQFKDSLAEVIPSRLPGWAGRDLPLAQSLEVANQVEERLRYEEAIFRTWVKGQKRILLYAAYWAPGTVPIREVAMHNPDTCWLLSGWSRLSREYAQTYELRGKPLLAAERGLYEKGNDRQDVVFWHLVEGEPLRTKATESSRSFADKLERNLLAPFRIMLDRGIGQAGDQFFIRLSVNVPLEEVWEDRGFRTLLESLGELGLYANPTHEP